LPLARFREEARISLEQVMEQTKISRHFLEAIERGEYERLPGGVFDRNYIRQYAVAVGYDAESILQDYFAVRGGVETAEPARRAAAAPRWQRLFL
jgi:cytoskeletal protein RodZ